jgi:hypothetical protein
MSFSLEEAVPKEYHSFFKVISPIEKTALLKVFEKIESDNAYEKLYYGLKDYLVKYQNEDISPLIFVMFGQIVQDVEKDEKINQMIELFPNSSELQLYKIESETEKGNFEDIEKVIAFSRLEDKERGQLTNRLVSANRLAKAILDLRSYIFEMRYYSQKKEEEKVKEIYRKAEKICKEMLDWSAKKESLLLIEEVARLILQYANLLMSIDDVETALKFFERKDIQEIFDQCQSTYSKASILYVKANIYYSASKPQEAIKIMEKGINYLEKVYGKKAWKANFYHNYGVMLSIIDVEKCIEAFETSLELIKDSEDYQSIAHTLSNLINLKMDNNQDQEAKEMLRQLVDLLDNNKNIITTFRAYSVVVNAISLGEKKLVKDYLPILKEAADKSPNYKNKGFYAGANLYYYMDLDINYQKCHYWGNEYLYYVTKEKNYLTTTTALFNLCIADLRFYKMTARNRFLDVSKKHLNELLTLIGKLELPQYVALKNTILAGYEILVDNYNSAKKYLQDIPEIEDKETIEDVQIMRRLLHYKQELAKNNKNNNEDTKSAAKTTELLDQPDELLLNKIINNNENIEIFVTREIELLLQKIIAIPSDYKPIQAEIRLMLLINKAGSAIYTKIIDPQRINRQLVSNFISAINSFAKELFGSDEPYFSFKRGNNIILYQNINPELSIAMIANQENYDSISKLNILTKEINDYLDKNDVELAYGLDDDSSFKKWLDKSLSEIMELS